MDKDICAEASAHLWGGKLYHERARLALPILVRQAQIAGRPVPYYALAQELGMPNPRNLNYVLGCIGETLQKLSKAWGERIPPIQCLVVNKQTGLPGAGIAWFLVDHDERYPASVPEQREFVGRHLQHIYAYRKWSQVLSGLGLDPVEPPAGAVQLMRAAGFFGGGEGEAHRRLKQYIATHPEVVGLPRRTPPGHVEFKLLSGDAVDVCFGDESAWVAVEVKSACSPPADILRGLFQCVKYKAVLEAMQQAEHRLPRARAILALETALPDVLVPFRNVLGTEVVEWIQLPIAVDER